MSKTLHCCSVGTPCFSAIVWVIPCTLAPTSPITWEPGRARYFAATPDAAPVRIALTSVPSMMQAGIRVSGSTMVITALARGNPYFAGLCGRLGIHLMPAVSTGPSRSRSRSSSANCSPPRNEGIDMMRPVVSSVSGPPQRMTGLPG